LCAWSSCTIRAVIPVNDLGRHARSVRTELVRAAVEVIDSGWYSVGPQLAKFEEAFAAYCGAEHCVGVGNGTDALELALRACGAGPGKRVVTVANAGGYSTTAILATGAEPVFIDVSGPEMLMDTTQLKAAISADTAAVIVTHLYGRMVDMPAVLEAAGAVPVIEDCAQAHGARLLGRPSGSWGVAGCFSFYPTKNLGALGDGGAVVTHEAEIAATIRGLRQYGWERKYRQQIAGGRNSRLDEMQACILLAQLPFLDGWNVRRREIADRYSAALRSAGFSSPPCGGPEYVAHLYVLASENRESLRRSLSARQIGTDIHYPVPDHLQNAWRQFGWAGVTLPETEAAAHRVLTIPCFPELEDAEITAIANALQEAFRPPRASM